uniref:CCHC-type domain-containing protein n=1 Tax=Nicotiana tabacum TaxID=4097 RepID=A0A1S3ZBG9_TOBAC|nr:uncharacterized protein LOC104110311 [Nicotiana tomentosiformis]XP_016461743.1 PREDICTED: uncharacterized protein LOC107785038 [Nicotiana tabacum]
MDGEGNKCNKREEEYDDEDRRLVQKNAKAKDLLYRGLPRNIIYKVSSCISAHDIWRTLEADFGDKNIEVALMAIEESQTEEEVIGMMSMSDSETEDETKQLISNLSCVKLDIKELESDKANLEGHVKDLKNQILELTSKSKKSPDIHGKGKMSDLSNKARIGYRKPVPKFDSKYVGISDNKMCTNCGKVGHFRDTCPALIHAQFRNTFGLAKNVKKEEKPKAKPFVHTKWINVNKKITANPLPFWSKVRGNNQDWYLDSEFSRHMTGEKKNFLSVTAFQGESVSFGNGKRAR